MIDIAKRFLQRVRDICTALPGNRKIPTIKPERKTRPSHRKILPPGIYAFSGKLPPMNTFLNHSAAAVSLTGLPNVIDPMVMPVGGGVVKFIWIDNSGAGNANPFDRVCIKIYCRSLKQQYVIITGFTRNMGEAIMDLSCFKNRTLNTWILLQAPFKGNLSPFAFTGKLFLS